MTAFFLWLALRGVPFGEVARAIAQANWGLLIVLSVPPYLVQVWVRGLRWRHLTDPIQPIAPQTLARAVSVGFMANNLFPLRAGEVVRCWYLARETGASVATLFGTVVLERIIDTVCVILLACLVVLIWGSTSDEVLAQGALLLLPLALLPILGLVWLKAAPEGVIRTARLVLRPVPRLADLVERMLRRFQLGLAALRGGRHLFWIAFHSASIWLVLSAIPIVAAFLALDIDLPWPGQMIGAAWMTQAAIGVAVAVPSAPGFFGIFHFACRVALVRFGVDPEHAVAAGTLIHAVMWVTLTGLGALVLRVRQTSLGEVDQAVAGPPEPRPR